METIYNGIILDGKVYEIIPPHISRKECSKCHLRWTCGRLRGICMEPPFIGYFRFNSELTDRINKGPKTSTSRNNTDIQCVTDLMMLPLVERLTETEKIKIRDEFETWETFLGTKDDLIAKGAIAILHEIFGEALFTKGGEE